MSFFRAFGPTMSGLSPQPVTFCRSGEDAAPVLPVFCVSSQLPPAHSRGRRECGSNALDGLLDSCLRVAVSLFRLAQTKVVNAWFTLSAP